MNGGPNRCHDARGEKKSKHGKEKKKLIKEGKKGISGFWLSHLTGFSHLILFFFSLNATHGLFPEALSLVRSFLGGESVFCRLLLCRAAGCGLGFTSPPAFDDKKKAPVTTKERNRKKNEILLQNGRASNKKQTHKNPRRKTTHCGGATIALNQTLVPWKDKPNSDVAARKRNSRLASYSATPPDVAFVSPRFVLFPHTLLRRVARCSFSPFRGRNEKTRMRGRLENASERSKPQPTGAAQRRLPINKNARELVASLKELYTILSLRHHRPLAA